MICGGVETLHNEIINGGSGTTIIAHPLSRYETGAYLLVPGLSAISAGLAKIVAATYVYDLIAVATATAGTTLAGAAFCVVGSAIGLGLMCVGVWVIIQIFKDPNVISIFIRSRKRYAYA